MLGRVPGAANDLDRCCFRGATELGSVEGKCQTTCIIGDGNWRVAPRLATSCVCYMSRVPSRGTMVLFGSRRGPPSVAFMPRPRFLVPRIPNSACVPNVTCAVPNIASRKLPLEITLIRCECGSQLDELGRNLEACPRSGRLRWRALPTERTLARVC